MWCSCGTETLDSPFCRQCGWQLAGSAAAETSPVATDGPATPSAKLSHISVFSAAAWLELRLGSVFAWTPRGFSERLKSHGKSGPA
jgi:hypothetical protein